MGSSIERIGMKLFNRIACFDVSSCAGDGPTDMPSCDFGSVFAVMVGVIGRLRLEGNGLLDDAAVLVGGRHGTVPLDGNSRGFTRCEAAISIWDGIGVADVGFDVEDRGAINEIDTRNNETRGDISLKFDAFQFDDAQAEAVGSEGGTGGEDSFLFIAAKSGRANSEAGWFFRDKMKLGDEPEVTECVDATHGFGTAEGRLKVDETPGIWCETGLTGHAKLGGVAGPKFGDDG